MYSESSVLRFFSQNVTVKMQKTTGVILVLVQNLVSHMKGRIYSQDISEQSAKV
jgi:sensor histidine kinase regulating citrate/malate metabolism